MEGTTITMYTKLGKHVHWFTQLLACENHCNIILSNFLFVVIEIYKHHTFSLLEIVFLV